MEVEHDREVGPTLCRPDVRDVSDLLLVWGICGEVLRDQVRRNWRGVLAVLGPLGPPFPPRHEAVLAHQPGRAMTPHLMAIVDQVAMHAQTIAFRVLFVRLRLLLLNDFYGFVYSEV